MKENISKAIDSTKQTVQDIIEIVKKVYKCKIAFKLGVKAYNTGYSVYSLFPKYDKITGIDTDKLIEKHTKNHNEVNEEDIELDKLIVKLAKEQYK